MIGGTRLEIPVTEISTDIVGRRHKIREFGHTLRIGACRAQTGVIRKDRQAIERLGEPAQLLTVIQFDPLHQRGPEVARRGQFEAFIPSVETIVTAITDNRSGPVEEIGDVLAEHTGRNDARRLDVIFGGKIISLGILRFQTGIISGHAAETASIRVIRDRGVGHEGADRGSGAARGITGP